MTGIIILAAGGSTRLGRPKQQLIFQGKSLLQCSVTAALHAGVGPVILVLGAGQENIRKEIEDSSVQVVINPDWQDGMSSSIRCGLSHLMQFGDEPKNALFMLCDQPFVSSELIKALVHEKKRSGKKIIACMYNDTLGVPALFDDSYFPELLFLTGNEGAKKLLFLHQDNLATIPFPNGSIDIDTPEDYEHLRRLSSNETAESGINIQTS